MLSTKNVIADQWYNCLYSKNGMFKIIGQILTQLNVCKKIWGVCIYMEGCVYIPDNNALVRRDSSPSSWTRVELFSFVHMH